MATAEPIQDQDEQEQEHAGGGRFNRLLGMVFISVAVVGVCNALKLIHFAF